MTEDEPEPVHRGREALARPVADFADPAEGWYLIMQCSGSCWVQRRLVSDLVPQVPPGLNWAEVLPKLRCSRCGEQTEIVGLSGPATTLGSTSTWLVLQLGKGE
jgi:hypothetical protein